MAKSQWIEVERRTKETDIHLRLRLDGNGKTDLKVEPFFLRHMLDSFAVHGGFDLEVKAVGEDEHHLIEDVAIGLGQAIRKAVPDLRIERIASALVPMDEALVLVAIDLVDRPYAQITLPMPMYAHFLRSMALDGKFTLHVRPIAGEDPHHTVEAAFKALGRALRIAAAPRSAIATTKGEVEWK